MKSYFNISSEVPERELFCQESGRSPIWARFSTHRKYLQSVHLKLRTCCPNYPVVLSFNTHCQNFEYNSKTQDRNQMFWPIFARSPLPETFKASFSRTNQTANK